MQKGLLDGYVGVKFQHERSELEPPAGIPALVRRFLLAGRHLAAHGMAPLNGGNMSVRLGSGFAVTASGSNLGILEPDEVVFVEACDAVAGTVRYRGPKLPSSEAIMHHLLLQARTGDQAVVHAHDPAVTREAMVRAGMVITDREEPYGTVALAERALEAFERAEDIIVLENHGYVCAGPSLEAVVDAIVMTHLRLSGGRG